MPVFQVRIERKDFEEVLVEAPDEMTAKAKACVPMSVGKGARLSIDFGSHPWRAVHCVPSDKNIEEMASARRW